MPVNFPFSNLSVATQVRASTNAHLAAPSVGFITGAALVQHGYGHAWTQPDAYRLELERTFARPWVLRPPRLNALGPRARVYYTQLECSPADPFTVATLQRYLPEVRCFWFPESATLIVTGDLDAGWRNWRDGLLTLEAPARCISPAQVLLRRGGRAPA